MILGEQMRQRMFGISEPQRFQCLVAGQSEHALRHAQAQAALDEREAYSESHGLESSTVIQVLGLCNTLEAAKAPLKDTAVCILGSMNLPGSKTPSGSESILAEISAGNAALLQVHQVQCGGIAA